MPDYFLSRLLKLFSLHSLPLLFLLLLLPLSSISQNTYVKTAGNLVQSDFGTSCKQTPGKGTILSMESSANGYNIHVGLVKADYNGTIQWAKLFQVGDWCFPQTVLVTPDSGYIVFGMATDSFAINVNNNFLFLLKTDSSGNEEWTKKYLLSANDAAISLIRCRAGGYLACSVADYNTGLSPHAVLMRLDEEGTTLWTKHYSAPYGIQPRGVVELSNRNIVFTSQSGSFSASYFNDVLVTQTDSIGNLLLTKVFGTYYDDEPNAIATDSADEIFITGRSYFIGREWDAFFLKLDRYGNKMLSKFYDAGTSNGEIMRCILAREDGSCTLLGDVGSFNERDITMMDLDQNGNLHWAKRYLFSTSFTNYPYDMYPAYDSGFVFTGDVRPPAYARDAALVKTDRDGNTSCSNSTVSFTVYNDSFPGTNVILTELASTGNGIPVSCTVPSNSLTGKLICQNPLPIPDFSYVADTACPKACVTFSDRSLNQPVSWLWEFTGADSISSLQQNPVTICFNHPGHYLVKLTVTNGFGTSVINRIIHLESDCPPETELPEPLFIPNVFTPNDDNRNDEFIIKGLPDEFTVHIFNRWGEELFSSSDKSINWRGRNKSGAEVPEGVYFYQILFGDKKRNGVVELIR